MNKLVCNSLTKSYGSKKVIDGVSLTLEPHRIYGLIGRNGAGKTTLLGLISGQNYPDSGDVTLDGEPVKDNQELLDQICFSRELSQILLFGRDTRQVTQLLKTAELIHPYWDNEYAQPHIGMFELAEGKRTGAPSAG